mgnify:CR=1 FL=1
MKKSQLIAALAFAAVGYGLIACNNQSKPADSKTGKVDLSSLPEADQKLIKQYLGSKTNTDKIEKMKKQIGDDFLRSHLLYF